MNTFKDLAEKIANVLNKPFTHELKERIKDSFKQVMATRIRQSFETGGIDEILKLNYSLELEVFDKIATEINSMLNQTTSIKNINYKLKTIDKVLPSIRFRNEAPFTRVSGLDGINIPFFNTTELRLNTNNIFKSTLSYNLDNGFIVVTSTNKDEKVKLKYINIEGIFESPDKVLNYYNDIVSDEDVAIPFPNDMIQSIFQEILKSEFGIIQVEENTVPLNNEVNAK